MHLGMENNFIGNFLKPFFVWDRHVNKFVSAKVSRECRVDHDRPYAKLGGAPAPSPMCVFTSGKISTVPSCN